MASIRLRNLTKTFGGDVQAVHDLSLEIAHGEIVCLLGPSGCGKTTTLRLIAGFEGPTAGELWIGDRLVSSSHKIVPPARRNLGMVFQDYAVWPHRNVLDNVGYPLKVRRMSRSEIRRRAREATALVGLEGLEKRYPEQLSGGQQQRVALARALVAEPEALLLDEPLSNLDAKLREKMRFEIMDLHRRLGLTLVYVTHDQAEAMVLSDWMVVMNQGKAEQIGAPQEIYRTPTNPFVADFIGLANFLPARLIELDGQQGIAELPAAGSQRVECSVTHELTASPPLTGVLFVRPEDVQLRPEAEADIVGKITRATFLGARLDVRVDVGGAEWRTEAPPEEDVEEGRPIGVKARRAIFFETEEHTNGANA